MSGFYKYAQAEPDFVAVVDPDGTEHAGRRPPGAGQPLRPPAPLARAGEGRQRRRRPPERRAAGRGVPRRAAGRLVLRADQLPALGARRSPTSSRTPGAKAIVSHERYAEVIAAAADEAGVPGRGPPRPRHRARLPRRRGRARRAARHAPRRPRRRRRHALHVGHHRQAQGREAQAQRRRPRRDGRAVHRLLQPVRHPPPRGPGAPLHLAELPHRRHHLRRQRPQLRPPRGVHGQVGPGRDAREDRALLGHPHPHGADAVPPHAAAARGREGQVRRVVDALGDPRRRAVPDRREAEDARLVGPGDLGVLRRHRGRRHHGHARGLAQVPRHGRQPVGDLRAEDHRRRRHGSSTPACPAPSG